MSERVRSSFCEFGNCLEAWAAFGAVFVHNNTDLDAPPVSFTFDQWPWFLRGVVDQEHPWMWFRDQDQIEFSTEEAEAFKAGVLAGEFDLDRLLGIDNR